VEIFPCIIFLQLFERNTIWLTWIALFGTDTLWAGGWESKPTDMYFPDLYCPVWPLHTLGGWAGISVCDNMIWLTLFGPDTLWVGGGEPRTMKLPFLVIPVFLCLPVFISLFSGIYLLFQLGFHDRTCFPFTRIFPTVVTKVYQLHGTCQLGMISRHCNRHRQSC
jgi:hypothetical protein